MDFDTLIKDIAKMAGMRLCSIRPGSDLVVDDVDFDAECILITTSQNARKSRPFSEMRTLWTALSTQPIVHVENALHGSGSSRNQPETILANLPYIEHLRYKGKKHIAYVGRPTHVLGTLKQMSAQDVAELSLRIEADGTANGYRALFVTDDIVSTGHSLSQKLGNDVKPLYEGFYQCSVGDDALLLCTESLVNLGRGVYTFIEPGHMPSSVDGRVQIGSITYAYINIDGGKFLSRE